MRRKTTFNQKPDFLKVNNAYQTELENLNQKLKNLNENADKIINDKDRLEVMSYYQSQSEQFSSDHFDK